MKLSPHFSSPLLKDIVRETKQQLRQAGVDSYALDGDLLCAHGLNISRERLISDRDRALSTAEQALIYRQLQRRLAREPMAHILGKREFWGREFKVTSATLDPRPDSETLIETVLENYSDMRKPLRMLDLGTGTGCLLLTLLCEFPMAEGVGIDLSEEALQVAKENCVHLGLENRGQFILQYWTEGMDDQFDVIISNPPYIKESDASGLSPEVREHEPALALYAGDDGLQCYKEIIPEVPRLLKKEGLVIFEIGEGQEKDVSAIIEAHGLQVTHYAKDLAGIIRCIAAKRFSDV